MNSHVELTKQLLLYSLNLFFEDNQNRNILYYAVTFNASIDMFDYLINQNVNTVSSVDLLSVLLKKQCPIKMIYYVEQLVVRGHPIT